MNAFGISIKVESFHANQQPSIKYHTLSNGKQLAYIAEYSPVFDLDNICEVLNLELFPGLGKSGWEEFFSYGMSVSESRDVKMQLAERGVDIELVQEVRDFIFSHPTYQYQRRRWSETVLVNTYGR